MPNAPQAAHALLTTNAPCRMVNSPMKPLSSGMPSELRRDDQIDGREVGHRRGQSAEFGNQARVAALIEDAEDKEERAVEMP